MKFLNNNEIKVGIGMENLNQLNALTLQEQLYAILQKKIQEGEYKPGEKIPSETQLGKTYNVSRVTVRSVLQKLVDQDILIKKRGKGTFVNNVVHTENVLTGGSFTETCKKMGRIPSTEIIAFHNEAVHNELFAELKDRKNEILLIKRVRKVDETPCILEVDYLPTNYAFLTNLQDSLLEQLERELHTKLQIFEDYFQIIFSTKEIAELLNCSLGTPILEVTQHVYNSKHELVYINKQYILTSKYIYAVQYKK